MFTSTRTTLGNTQPKYSSASAVANARQKQHNKAFANQTNQFNDIEKKFIIFTQTLNFENIKVKDIETLQQLLKPLLDTIILSNDPNSSINKPHNLYYEGKTNKKSDKPDGGSCNGSYKNTSNAGRSQRTSHGGHSWYELSIVGNRKFECSHCHVIIDS